MSQVASPPQTRPVDQYWQDLVAFTREMLASKDIDPLYDMLRGLYERLQLNSEERLWFTTLYVAFYNLPSALSAWRLLGDYVGVTHERLDQHKPVLRTLPTGIERRGLRGGAVVPYLHHFLGETQSNYERRYGVDPTPLSAWYTKGWQRGVALQASRTFEDNYECFWKQWDTIKGNGRWSAFKMAEILRRVHDLPLRAPDMRMEFCSGPKEGLVWLYDAHDASAVGRDDGLDVTRMIIAIATR